MKANLELEKFYVVKNFDDTVSFKSKKDNKYIIVQNDFINLSESEEGAKFHPINNSDNTVSFRLAENEHNKYILGFRMINNFF